MTDKELGNLIGKFYGEDEPLVPNLDTSTEEGQRWRLHMITKDREGRRSVADGDPYFDYRD